MSETPGAAHEANDARKHADAMSRHRQHVVDSISELERKQDELLDKLTSKPEPRDAESTAAVGTMGSCTPVCLNDGSKPKERTSACRFES